MPWGTRVSPRINPNVLIKNIEFAKKLSAIPQRYGKPLILSEREEGMSGPIYNLYIKNHIPFLSNPFDCAKMLAAMVKYGERHGNN